MKLDSEKDRKNRPRGLFDKMEITLMDNFVDKNYCFGCFSVNTDNDCKCSKCGYLNSNQIDSSFHLIPGTVIHDHYLIGKVLGQGGFGITYLALNLESGKKVAIKEYFPDGIVTRTPGESKVRLYLDERKDKYNEGIKKFLKEARMLSKFSKNPNIINVYNYFLDNNTAYYVMEYVEGINLKQYLSKKGGKISVLEVYKIILPIIDGLDEVHQNDILHRDISPENIYLTFDNIPKLIDFGSARQIFDNTNKSLSIVLKPGFAPEEQYRKRGIQGPWTDIYSLGATMYYALSGEKIPDAIDRLHDDSELRQLSDFVQGVNEDLEKVIMKAISPLAENRFSSLKEFKNALVAAVLYEKNIPSRSVKMNFKTVLVNFLKKPFYRGVVLPLGLVTVVVIILHTLNFINFASVLEIFNGNSFNKIGYVNTNSNFSRDDDENSISEKSSEKIESGESNFLNVESVSSEEILIFVPTTHITNFLSPTPALTPASEPAIAITITPVPKLTPTQNPTPTITNTILPTITTIPTPTPEPVLSLANIKTGALVSFGSFEQDNNLLNGKEELLWRVLDIKDKKALLLSHMTLDRRPYHNEFTGRTWETSSLRTWLNNEFLNTAFSMEESSDISITTVENPDCSWYGTPGGETTLDKVFILSVEEVEYYFPELESRIASRSLYNKSKYVIAENPELKSVWWSRSPWQYEYIKRLILFNGKTNSGGAINEAYDIRPAIWIDLE